jgi:hypothetical protein
VRCRPFASPLSIHNSGGRGSRRVPDQSPSTTTHLNPKPMTRKPKRTLASSSLSAGRPVPRNLRKAESKPATVRFYAERAKASPLPKGLEVLGQQGKEFAFCEGPQRAERAGASESLDKGEGEGAVILPQRHRPNQRSNPLPALNFAPSNPAPDWGCCKILKNFQLRFGTSKRTPPPSAALRLDAYQLSSINHQPVWL